MKSKKIKLVIVCGNLSSGGAERVISVLSDRLLDSFEYIEILTWREGTVFYQFDSHIKITSIISASRSNNILSNIYWFRKYILKMGPYAVLSFLAPFNILTRFSLLRTSIPVLVADRNDPVYDCPNKFWRKVRDYFYSLSSGVCVQTLKNKEYFSKVIQNKTKVIYNPAFIPEEMIGKALHVEKKKYIVSIGRLTKQKNQELLLNAFERIYQLYPEYRLIIYGEGELREVLEQKIKELHLESIVKLPGAREDVHSLILDAEVFVLSSDYEGMPNALIEAMCLGLPCISTRVSGATELISNSKNGLLVDIGDCESLTKSLLYLLENKSKAKEIATEAVEIANELNLDTIVGKWVDFIVDSVEKNRKL